MELVDNAFGQRMVIVADRANLPVREKEFLSLERVPATHDSAIDGNEKFVVDTRLRRTSQPAPLDPAIEQQVIVLKSTPPALIAVRHRPLVLRTLTPDDDGQAWQAQALR